MAYIKIEYAGSKTFGGYLTVDGGVEHTLSNHMLIYVDAGVHYLEYSDRMKYGNPTVYYGPTQFVKGSITVDLGPNDLAVFTVISNANGRVVNVPSYEIVTLTDDEIIQLDNSSTEQFQYEMKAEGSNLKTELLLCIFLGWLGIHKFYKGKVFLGLLYMFSLGLCGIGWLIDTIVLVVKVINQNRLNKRIS